MQMGSDVMAMTCTLIEDFHNFLIDNDYEAVEWRSPGFCRKLFIDMYITKTCPCYIKIFPKL